MPLNKRKSRGFAFVTMKNKDEDQNAVEKVNNSNLDMQTTVRSK